MLSAAKVPPRRYPAIPYEPMTPSPRTRKIARATTHVTVHQMASEG
jgi:hypothetical protein